ncbi:class II aldolase/adducin family protein [Lactobacillus sp. YT155]|uniref:class II aldolase/adducin family protein n=1 Tax=Lactobacillus sp. YT155 TaxID=3060955 RepID=UPI00265DBC18|nr:class II aldolase/adducin family protein [Lactobacillus sp. YT155]MDO1604927.1 class II aldolase/adducin family protein [Lactobacillus sp. YT155]
MRMMFETERADLAHTVQKMFDRKNTNVAGGNMSIKVFDKDGHPFILMTPTMMSETYYSELHPAQILVIDGNTYKKIDGVGDVTREVNMHERAYLTHPGIRCVYHSHAENSMFWATSGLDMPNLTEATRELGEIKNLPFAPATSEELADVVKNALSNIGDKAMENVFLLNSHGVLITSTDLHVAARILETLEWNAKIAYQQTIFKKIGILNELQSCGQDANTPMKPGTLASIPLPGDDVKSYPKEFPTNFKRPNESKY